MRPAVLRLYFYLQMLRCICVFLITSQEHLLTNTARCLCYMKRDLYEAVGMCLHLNATHREPYIRAIKERYWVWLYFLSSPGVLSRINDQDEVSITQLRALWRGKPAKQTYLIFHRRGPSGAISQYSSFPPFPDAFSTPASFQTEPLHFFPRKKQWQHCRDLHERKELLKC